MKSPAVPPEPVDTRRSVWRWVNLPAIALIWAYKFTLSPFVGGQCRFLPTCSTYALGVYKSQNPLRGTSLVVRRLLRCHPWGGGGYDPAPLPGEAPERAH